MSTVQHPPETCNAQFTAAVEHVRRAGVIAPPEAISRWIQGVGPAAILSTTLREIREVANAF